MRTGRKVHFQDGTQCPRCEWRVKYNCPPEFQMRATMTSYCPVTCDMSGKLYWDDDEEEKEDEDVRREHLRLRYKP